MCFRLFYFLVLTATDTCIIVACSLSGKLKFLEAGVLLISHEGMELGSNEDLAAASAYAAVAEVVPESSSSDTPQGALIDLGIQQCVCPAVGSPSL